MYFIIKINPFIPIKASK